MSRVCRRDCVVDGWPLGLYPSETIRSLPDRLQALAIHTNRDQMQCRCLHSPWRPSPSPAPMVWAQHQKETTTAVGCTRESPEMLACVCNGRQPGPGPGFLRGSTTTSSAAQAAAVEEIFRLMLMLKDRTPFMAMDGFPNPGLHGWTCMASTKDGLFLSPLSHP